MKFPSLFRPRPGALLARGAQDQAEKALAEAFRLLGQACARIADLVEAQRLSRSGYEDQGKFLERTDFPDQTKKS